MSILINKINKETELTGGQLEITESELHRKGNRALLAQTEFQCPAPDDTKKKGGKGKTARSKSRNLLDRFRDFEDECWDSWIMKSFLFQTTRLKMKCG